MPDNGNLPYHFAVLPLKNMIVDAYQRPLTSFVEKIEREFDPALVGTICVSERPRHKYAIIDGQTRAEGMRRTGLTDAPCIVYTGLSPAEEAELFSKFQTERRGMTSSSRFKAQVIAGHPDAVAIQQIVEAAGLSVDQNTKNNNAVAAVGAMEFVYQGTFGRRGKDNGKHPELLRTTLQVITEAWPRLPDTAKSAVMIRGLGWYLARTPEGKQRTNLPDMERLVSRLKKVTPSDLAKRAEALREGRGMSGNSPAYMAEAIEAQYRKRVADAI